MSPTVSVLLSTYNGELYIRDLVDSILSQNNVNVLLQVRDDGSSDSTVSILESYHDSRILITKGENLKPAKSFLRLLKDCRRTEYYAWCDQDDVWYSDKLAYAIDILKKYSDPALFISTYDIVDKNLNKLFTFDMNFEEPFRLQDTLIYRAPSACTMVFNDFLRTVINKSTPEFVRMHDFWTLLIAESHKFRIITDDIPLIKYRQHEKNTVGIFPSIATRINRLIRSAFLGDHERLKQAKCLYDAYKYEIGSEEVDILETVIKYRRSIKNRIALINDNRFITGRPYIDFLFRISILFSLF